MAETPVVPPLEIANAGMNAFALRQSDWIDARALSAGGAAETNQAPAGARYVLFSANGDFYCRIAAASTAATVPADTTDGSASELNPAMRYIGEQDYISLISPTSGATIVTMMFYKN
jgi:hypothetical protein